MSERHARLAELFEQAIALPPRERDRFLEDACSDAALRDEVRDLLAHDEAAPARFLGGSPAPQPGELGVPETIGRYRVLRVIGVGGMGMVYEAEQDAPRRRVALKVIRPDVACATAPRRFQREADILGQLQHPGIAHIYEAGVVRTALGEQPYFAMELVAGEPIDEYAGRRGLDSRARLALVALICDAVQHAHERGVIHRDLKPANILVADAAPPGSGAGRPAASEAPPGWPKVLDFGVARFTDGEARGMTRTEAGQLIGTLSYMSPEQVRAEPGGVDGRADVYAIGVILYELLCGEPPLDLAGRTLPEAASLIREKEPSRLASRAGEFRGDIDTIVSKAIEKDPARRYASPGALAADIRRMLRDEPIEARPASTFYQLRKFARRNRALVGGAAATFAVLVIGLIASAYFGIAAVEDRNAARSEMRRAERTAYRASLVAAAAALGADDVLTARRRLEAAPVRLRRWEWRHLWRQLDESEPAPPGGARYAARLASGAAMPETDHGYGCYEITPDYRAEAWVEYDQRAVYFRELETGATRQVSLAGLPGLIMPPQGPADLSAAGQRAAFTDDRGRLVVIDLDSQPPVARPITSAERIGWLCFSPAGDHLLVAHAPGDVQVFDVASGALRCTISGAGAEYACAVFTSGGRRVVLGRRSGPITMWDVTDGRLLATAPMAPEHTHWLTVSPAPRADVPGGYMIVSGAQTGSLRLWGAETLEPLGVLRGHTTPAICWFSGDAMRLVSYPADPASPESHRLWDLRTLEPDVLRGHRGYVYPVLPSPDGARIYSGGWDGYFGAETCLRAWDVESGDAAPLWPSAGLQWISGLACADDGRLVVAGGGPAGGLVRAHGPDGAIVAEFAEPAQILDIALHPAGAIVAVMPPGTVRDLETGAIVARLDGAGGRGVDWAPDGGRLVASGAGHAITVWDAATWRPVQTLAGHDAEVTRIRHAPDGRRIASASEDGTVRIWSSGGVPAELATLPHTDGVLALAWHPDGTRLATAGRSRLIRLWDTATWEELTQLAGHSSYIYSLAFTPDGECLVSGSGDHTVRLWRASGVGGP
ncbi:MAG: WD40 repeat domain-containing serine/threonine protein kinase [Phycisphaerales bacterium JB039]